MILTGLPYLGTRACIVNCKVEQIVMSKPKLMKFKKAPRPLRPTDFGMDARPRSMRWSDVSRGPTRSELLTHLAKLARFVALAR
jgi:hypothetical protein